MVPATPASRGSTPRSSPVDQLLNSLPASQTKPTDHRYHRKRAGSHDPHDDGEDVAAVRTPDGERTAAKDEHPHSEQSCFETLSWRLASVGGAHREDRGDTNAEEEQSVDQLI